MPIKQCNRLEVKYIMLQSKMETYNHMIAISFQFKTNFIIKKFRK